MKEFTQTNLSPGNCWQTSIACILELDPAELPDQVAIEASNKSYGNAIRLWLVKNRNLYYSTLDETQFPVLRMAEPGWHLLEGETVRTPAKDIEHVVVGRYGELAWDPHPSRAGLTKVKRWGLLVPCPDYVREHWLKADANGWLA